MNDDGFWKRVQKSDDGSDGCWVWIGNRRPDGYGLFYLFGKQLRAHRVSWEMHNGPIPEGVFVCHRCDNPSCVRPSHLFLGTIQDNNADRVQKGRPGSKGVFGEHNGSHKYPERRAGERNGRHTHPETSARGERHGRAKLTEEAVKSIRERYAAGGVSYTQLAHEFGVSFGLVGFVVNRKVWAHVP